MSLLRIYYLTVELSAVNSPLGIISIEFRVGKLPFEVHTPNSEKQHRKEGREGLNNSHGGPALTLLTPTSLDLSSQILQNDGCSLTVGHIYFFRADKPLTRTRPPPLLFFHLFLKMPAR